MGKFSNYLEKGVLNEKDDHSDPDDPEMQARIKEISEWIEGRIDSVISEMKKNPLATCTVVINDAHDRCGARIGRYAMARLGTAGVGDRATLGVVIE